MIFKQMKLGKREIPPFHVIFALIIHFFMTLIIHFFMTQGIFKVKKSISRSIKQNYHFYQIKLGTCVTAHFHRILTSEINLWYYFGDPRSSLRSKDIFQGRKYKEMKTKQK